MVSSNSYLYSSFTKFRSLCQFFTSIYVRILSSFKGLFQFIQLVSGKSGARPALFPFQWDSRLSLQVRVVILVFDCNKSKENNNKKVTAQIPKPKINLGFGFPKPKTRFRSYTKIYSRLSLHVRVVILVFDCNKSKENNNKKVTAQIPKPKINLGFGFPKAKTRFWSYTKIYILGSAFRFKSSFQSLTVTKAGKEFNLLSCSAPTGR